MLNDPYHGGTHLPDVTVVTPVYPGRAGAPVGTRRMPTPARRSGRRRASSWPRAATMPTSAASRRAPCRPSRRRSRRKACSSTTSSWSRAARCASASCSGSCATAPHPARNPEQNLADSARADRRRTRRARRNSRRMVADFGADTVERYMRHVQDNAEECVRRVISALKDGEFTLPLDNGARIRVAVRVDAAAAQRADRFHAAPARSCPNNFNAPRAITVAAVLYVFRTLVEDEIPLNAGCLKPLEIIVPEGCMLNPHPPAAVVAGNVGDLDLRDQRALRRARGHGREPVHHEQFHLRQRALSILRDHLPAARARGRICRHERGADAHDQFAAHRSRSAGIPLPGAARVLRDPRRIGRRGALAGRRRRRAPRAISRGHDGLDLEQWTSAGRFRHGRRRSRRAR